VQRPGVAWAVAAAHLLWWLAYGITLRPEPLIALGTAAVMVLAELARRRRSIGALTAAIAVAALTCTVSPTGLVGLAPLVLCLPWLWQWWQAADRTNRVAAVLLAGAAASIVIPIGFADATLGDVLEATAVHRWYYRQNAWYEEYLHYASLLAPDERGAWGKRLPVLLPLGVLLTVAIGSGRVGRRPGPGGHLLSGAAVTTALGLAALTLTPTKWVNHFGAIAAPATVLLAAAVLRSPLPRRAPAAVVGVGAAVLVAAASVGFAGPNLWRPLSDWGQPFGYHALLNTPYEFSLLAPSLGPLMLRNPVLWVAVAGLGWWWARRRGWPGPDRAVLVTATALGVGLMLVVFTVAPLRQYPGTSVALMNLRALGGQPCGLATSVAVLADAQPGLGLPTGAAELTGDMREAPMPKPPPLSLPGIAVWQDDVSGGAGTGSVQTPWYPLPGAVRDGRVIVPLRGDFTKGQQLAVQVAAGPGRVHTVAIDPVGEKSDWTEIAVALADAGLDTPTAVRVVAQDRLAGPGSWMAIAAPRLAVPRPITDLIATRPVFADQVSAALWPCEHQIVVRDGLVQAPEVRLRAADGLEDSITKNSTFADNGATLLQVDRTAQFIERPSQLLAPGMPTLGWGHVDEVIYSHPVGQVDLHVAHVRRAGWTRLPTLTGERYTGRAYIG
ncbi:MAG TPA: arabinosyltransferase domain-containing protein, partial [Pseudonocardiaceae bacterium]